MNEQGASHLSHTKTTRVGRARKRSCWSRLTGKRIAGVGVGGPGASVLLMKRCAFLGSLLAPSPCPLFTPGLLLPRAPGLARVPRAHCSAPRRCGHNGERRAEPCGRSGGRSRERGEASPLLQPGRPFHPGVPALRRPLAPCSREQRCPRGAGAGRAHLAAEVPRYPSRGHCAAGRQVG